LVRGLEVPVVEFLEQRPWCVSLLLPVVRSPYLLHMNKRTALYYFSILVLVGTQRKKKKNVKTISPEDAYPDDRTGKSNAAANAHQVRVNHNCHKKAKDLGTRLGGDQQDGFDAELNTFGQDGVVLGPVFGAFGEIPSHVDLLADVIAGALTAENVSFYGNRGSKTAKAYYRRVLYRAWGLTAHRGWALTRADLN